eukprot:TRINITY_DN1246_c0_g2_i1.p1 TRINITY_DN1246_c0_g2~~TRINITY_DN1246_c0_g2_i1.p1  ORF type:complete len:844 (+),score=234.65 TRINITY_DN1246_c0_g2_i1:364-2532(+)
MGSPRVVSESIVEYTFSAMGVQFLGSMDGSFRWKTGTYLFFGLTLNQDDQAAQSSVLFQFQSIEIEECEPGRIGGFSSSRGDPLCMQVTSISKHSTFFYSGITGSTFQLDVPTNVSNMHASIIVPTSALNNGTIITMRGSSYGFPGPNNYECGGLVESTIRDDLSYLSWNCSIPAPGRFYIWFRASSPATNLYTFHGNISIDYQTCSDGMAGSNCQDRITDLGNLPSSDTMQQYNWTIAINNAMQIRLAIPSNTSYPFNITFGSDAAIDVYLRPNAWASDDDRAGYLNDNFRIEIEDGGEKSFIFLEHQNVSGQIFYFAAIPRNSSFNLDFNLKIVTGSPSLLPISTIVVSTSTSTSTPTSTPSSTSTSTSDLKGRLQLIVGLVVGAFVFIILGIVGIFILKRRVEKQIQRNFEDSLLLPMDNARQLFLEDIQVQEKLGEGKFGEVYRGIWEKTTPVALKKLRADDCKQDFDREMKFLSNFAHRNIVQFLGIFVENSNRYIVTEFLELGSLDNFLYGNSQLEARQLLSMARDAAAGMNYLSNQGIIHRDLAARNLLVLPGSQDSQYRVKVADFGMARVIKSETEYYNTSQINVVPVKWTAIEAIERGKFSSQSDVWSFGVVLWEIFSFGRTPFPALSNAEAFQKIKQGQRLEQPDRCPDEVYMMAMHCWSMKPQDRPTFLQLFERISDLINPLAPSAMRSERRDLNVTYPGNNYGSAEPVRL